MPAKEGVNPRGITANEIWQTDVTHIAEFGKLKDVHVTVDTHSRYINATAHTGEKAKDVIRHWLSCFAILGIPKTIKTDNGPAYCSEKIKTFLTDWGVLHSIGIPHSPTGQAIVERTHHTLKEMLQRQKRGESVYSPQERLWKASYVLNFLNCDDTDHSRYEHHHKTQMLSSSKPPVMIKDLISGQWSGPVDLITWGRGYACVSKGTKLQWVPSRCVRPYISPLPQQEQPPEEISEGFGLEET
ncbi:PREDICTED: endogenous retrovirus group K member 25 Pol protein-like [Lepidothrix coronata]|uniref:Endogenous retrovirus group K member 25 Pol protein-like n=1 Tax=Lepidothrix coronata TaxID=321398 RepID=A0A6J0HMV5_9PASS|nr:PREDICTED: endogenous retrovirus group K member 25 Pol protein-like [Lepidothrix coronata]